MASVQKQKSATAVEKVVQNGYVVHEDETLSDPEMEAERQYRKTNRPDGDTTSENSASIDLVKPASKPRTQSGGSVAGEYVPTSPSSVLLPNGVVQVARAQKNMRKSRTASGRGGAKKGGSGGKYTWGNPLQVYEGDEPNDPDDPNYDSDTTGGTTLKEIEPIKMDVLLDQQFVPIVAEHFENPNLREAVDAIRDLKWTGEARVAAIKYLIVLGMDHKDSARELTSEMLAELVFRRTATQTEVQEAFTSLMTDEMSELLLDYPTACDLLGRFAARAVADLALASDAINDWKLLKEDTRVGEVVTRAEALLKQKQRLHDIWGVGGGGKPVRFLSNQIQIILQEYLSSGDTKEAARCLQELEVPHFNHDLVYQAGVMSLEGMHERTMRLLAMLIKHLLDEGELTADAVTIGFERLFKSLPDLQLDVPPAYTLAEHWCVVSKSMGYLPAEMMRKLPQKGRKRFVSEGDGGRLKVTDVPHPYI